jgi:hypothetical protein
VISSESNLKRTLAGKCSVDSQEFQKCTGSLHCRDLRRRALFLAGGVTLLPQTSDRKMLRPRFHILTTATVKMAAFWIVVPCSVVEVY